MWKSLKNQLWSWWPKNTGVLLLFFIWLIIVLTNTEPGTWFLSWDLMDSSFNPLGMMERSILHTWQSFQGLGLLGGHGYAAQLPQAIIQLILSIFIKQNYLRYAFTYLMLLSGIIGAYFLIRRIIPQKKSYSVGLNLPAFAAGFAYLLHFGTVQNFYVALEPFIAMYGLLPWILIQIFTIFKNPTVKNFLVFFILSFFFSMIGFIPPVFISYLFFLSVICAAYLFIEKFSRASLATCLFLVSIVVVTNLYWLSSVGIFTLTQTNDYLDSRLNQLTTEEYIYKNAEYGRIENSIRVRGFLLDSFDRARFGTGKELESIFTPWETHFNNPIISVIEYFLSLMFLLGLVALCYICIKQRKVEFSIGFLGILTLSLLTIDTPPFSFISIFFRAIPVLNQAFRIPYSKFSMSLVLFYSIGFGYLLNRIEELLREKIQFFKLKKNSNFISIFFIGLICIYSSPSFTGNFLYKGARVSLPSEYLETIKFFNAQSPEKRIAILPIYTYSGWDMHDWKGTNGYTGSGFLWYAIKQPILSRSFDVWNPYNETYRNEMVRAVYSQDVEQFKQIIEKYNISFLIVDRSLFLPNVPRSHFYSTEITKLITASDIFEKKLEGENISLYETKSSDKNSLIAPHSYSEVSDSAVRTLIDPVYKNFPNTITAPKSSEFIFTNLNHEKVKRIAVTDQNLIITSNAITETTTLKELPELDGKNISFNLFFLKSGETSRLIFEPILPELTVNNQKILKIPQLYIDLPDSMTNQLTELKINEVSFTFLPDENAQIPIGTLPILFNSSIQMQFNGETLNNPGGTFWQPLRNLHFDEKISLNKDQLVNANFPIQKTYWDFRTKIENSIVNCGLNLKGEIYKKITPEGIEYFAENKASTCDYVFIDNMPLNQGYLLHVKGTNQSGDSLKIVAISNETKYPALTVKVDDGKFDQWFTLLPSSEAPGTGYQFLLENQSYGAKETINSISEFSVYTAPIDYLLQLHTDQIKKSEADNLVIKEYKKIGSGIVVAQISNMGSEAAPIALLESYNIGWIAIVNYDFLHPLMHEKFNGWANAWMLPEGENKLTIIFWPQIMTILFFVVGILAGAVIVRKSIKKEMYIFPQLHFGNKTFLGFTKSVRRRLLGFRK